MATKIYKPFTPSRRYMTGATFEEITRKDPEKSLTVPIKSKAGRNNSGQVTVRHQGGGHKRLYRKVDFRHNRFDIPAKVLSIEYDPNRTSRIALIEYQDGIKSYVLAAENLKVGDTVVASKKKTDIHLGNRMPLGDIPVGSFVYEVELEPGSGAKLVRSAGNAAQIMAREGNYVLLKLPSTEVRRFLSGAQATIGRLGNSDHENVVGGKAGRSRWKGIRPSVRGKAMNPVDHPHGGGEGRSPIGLTHPKTPWGKPALGPKTRNKKKASGRLVVSPRRRGKA